MENVKDFLDDVAESCRRKGYLGKVIELEEDFLDVLNYAGEHPDKFQISKLNKRTVIFGAEKGKIYRFGHKLKYQGITIAGFTENRVHNL